MSIFGPISESPRLTPWSSSRETINGDEPVLRAAGGLSLLGIGAVHFLQIVATFEATPLLGVAFLILIGACLAVAARLCLHGGDERMWTASAVVCAAAIGGYIFTRLFNTPLDSQDVGNWSCMLGLAALFVEATLLAFSAYTAAVKVAFKSGSMPARVSGDPGSIGRESSSAA